MTQIKHELLSELVDPNFKWGADTHRLSADVLIDAPGSKKGRGRGKGLGTGRGSREERPAAGYRKAIKSAKAEAKAMLGDDLQLLRGKARLAAIGAAKGRGGAGAEDEGGARGRRRPPLPAHISSALSLDHEATS